MKVIEAQSAVLTNYEVYKHLVDQREAEKKRKDRDPPNTGGLVTELLQYFATDPNPLSQKPLTYTPESIPLLLERLRPYDLSKGEIVMILNLRPVSIPGLNSVVDDMADRFTDEQQEEMINHIVEVLGQFPAPAADANGDAEEDADVSMNDTATS